MLARCCQDFGQRGADLLSFRFPPSDPQVGWDGFNRLSEVNLAAEARCSIH